jgi:hypothetical protein
MRFPGFKILIGSLISCVKKNHKSIMDFNAIFIIQQATDNEPVCLGITSIEYPI